MKIRACARRVALAAALLAASMLVVPLASAHVHVGVGISVPGLSIGVGNCWRCGYRVAPPVYYQPAYAAPVYYPAPVYYAPPVYYGYGYSSPYYSPYYGRRGYRHAYRHHDRGHHGWHRSGGYYHHGHR